MGTTDPRLEGALEYARRGWPVFPVGENKLPAVKQWESVATTDEKQIRAWFEDTFLGGCNFGFPPGRAGIAVIDLDVEKQIKQPDGSFKSVSGYDSLADFERLHDQLPVTYAVTTPSGGMHKYFRAADLRSKNHFLDAVDVKSCGGYVLVPGSGNAKGVYALCNPDAEVVGLPEWFLALYGHKKSAQTSPELSFNTRITPDTEDKVARARQIIGEWPEAVEGERNDQLFQLMRELCKAGVSRARATELYAEEALEKIGLDPDSTEVMATIRSAYGDLSDLGAESREGREAAVRMFDDLPDLPPEQQQRNACRFSDNGGADWLDLAAKPVPPRRWFIENWLSADEGYTVLFSGRGGTGKSALMLDLMHSLATGEPFCGMPVMRGARTMFVSCEDSEEEIARRIQKRSVDHTKIPRGALRIWPRLGQNNILCLPDKRGILQETPFMEELQERGKEFFGESGGVLILDTLSDIFAGNENDRSQVSQFVKQHLNRLGMKLGVTIIVLAHPAKGASLSGQGFSGSTAWEGAFRCRWELNYQKAEKVDGLLELVLAKSNTTRAGLKLVLENRSGMFIVVDDVKADEGVKQELIRLIAEAYEEGNPFGRGKCSPRPVESVHVADPITGELLTETEIKQTVSELLAEARIESFKTNRRRGLKPREHENDCGQK